MKLVWKMMSSGIAFVLFAFMVCFAFVVISAKASGGSLVVMGYQLESVLSRSMEPTFSTGSMIAIKPTKDGSTYREGDIITFKEEDKLVTHRIIGVQHVNGNLLYETKGDNNNDPDLQPVLAENVVGIYAGVTVPYVGYLLDGANVKAGEVLLLLLPGVLLFGYSILSMFGAMRSVDAGKKKKSSNAGQSV